MITIRQLKPDEWALYKNTRLQALRSDPDVYGETLEGGLAVTDEKWREVAENPNNGNFILFDGDTPIGIAAVYKPMDKPGTANVIGDWVAPAYRGKGLSKLLHDARVDWARRQGDITKLVTASYNTNAASVAAIRKSGFTFSHSEESRFGGDVTEDYYVMDL